MVYLKIGIAKVLFGNVKFWFLDTHCISKSCFCIKFKFFNFFSLDREAELAIVYLLTLVLTLAHLHYAICVVIQMCQHLKISCFKIKNYGEERLLDEQDDTAEQNDSKSSSAFQV